MPRFLAACCLLLAAAWSAAAEPIPADCRWVVSLDVPAVINGRLGGWIRTQLGKQQTAAQLRVLEAITGLDPLRDLRRITICGAAGGDATGLVLVRGTFDAGRITTAAEAASDHATVTAGSRTIHTWTDKGQAAAGCLAAPDLLVLGRTAERIRQALAALDAGAAPPIALPAGWEGAAMAVAAADGLDQFAGAGPQSALMKNFRSIAARVSESGDLLVLEARAAATDEAQAQQLIDAGNGLRAIVLLQKPENLDPALMDSIRTAQFGRTGADLTLRLSLPLADAQRLIEQKKRGG